MKTFGNQILFQLTVLSLVLFGSLYSHNLSSSWKLGMVLDRATIEERKLNYCLEFQQREFITIGNGIETSKFGSKQCDTILPTKDLKLLDLTKLNATQSSTVYGAGANFAIDGNTDGDFKVHDITNSVSHTEFNDYPWWQVDLEVSTKINSIVVWNRTSQSFGHRLNGYILEVLDNSKNVLFKYDHDNKYFATDTFIKDSILGINISGRYVRIRLDKKEEVLSIAELQILQADGGIKRSSNNSKFNITNKSEDDKYNYSYNNSDPWLVEEKAFEIIDSSKFYYSKNDRVILDRDVNYKSNFNNLIKSGHLSKIDLTKLKATQSSTNYGAGANFAIDGNMHSDLVEHNFLNSVTHTQTQLNPWWKIDLETAMPIHTIVVWNRTDDLVGYRLNSYVMDILNEDQDVIFSYRHQHNFKNKETFTRDTITNINMNGRFVRIRLETPKFKPERLSIAEIEIIKLDSVGAIKKR